MVCHSTGKEKHPTYSDAKLHLVSLKRERGYKGAVYRCRYCYAYHVGRSRKVTSGRPVLKERWDKLLAQLYQEWTYGHVDGDDKEQTVRPSQARCSRH